MSSEEQTFKAENVKVIKLTTGDTILAYMAGIDQEKNVIALQSPYRIVGAFNMELEQMTMYLQPWFEFANNLETHIIGIQNIMAIASADEDGCARFIEQFREDSRESVPDFQPEVVWENPDEPTEAEPKSRLKLIVNNDPTDDPTYH